MPLQAEEGAVQIKVDTLIEVGGQKETFELAARGQYRRKGESIYLQYDEVLEEGTVHTTVKIKGGEVLILRSGAVSMRMQFREGKTVPGTFQSSYGLLQMEADTKQVDIRMGQIGQGRLGIVYDCRIQGTFAGTYYMNIDYKEEQE